MADYVWRRLSKMLHETPVVLAREFAVGRVLQLEPTRRAAVSQQRGKSFVSDPLGPDRRRRATCRGARREASAGVGILGGPAISQEAGEFPEHRAAGLSHSFGDWRSFWLT